ncbi:MAG: 50S ribosomal protein L3 [Desulfobulbaceae bacterium]|uniref:Large ribosomal subunit protein uL3 n=1 Tax=Candidatus Desulfatifera sulfidica TaxID=2841691 RepID=A0A8J6N9E2_9BACT|nr:50S ribosomal protein L3 [Candidatus Desulfatifera sulfidica]
MPKTMGILGKKIGMTRIYNEMGFAVPVTVIEAGPCTVLQVKSEATDGYNAIQVGLGEKKASRVNKPQAGHVAKSGSTGFYNIKEFHVSNPEDYEIGQKVSLEGMFQAGDVVDVQGTSKGRGFQGVIKRHGFHGGGATHGSKFHRAPGSIGCSAWPSRVIKGKKMPGRMGNDIVTKKNVLVMDVRTDENLILVKGSVPGAKQGLLKIFSK